jgi:hypothetical protein
MKFRITRRVMCTGIGLCGLGVRDAWAQQAIVLDPRNTCAGIIGIKQPETHYAFGSTKEAEKALKDILDTVPIAANFLLQAGDVDAYGAASTFQNGQRIILYSQVLMEKIRSVNVANADWIGVWLLAHEVGHHLNFHFDAPAKPRSREQELQADRFAGKVVARLGGSFEQACLAINRLASESGDAIYPPKRARLEAVAVGYHGEAPPPLANLRQSLMGWWKWEAWTGRGTNEEGPYANASWNFLHFEATDGGVGFKTTGQNGMWTIDTQRRGEWDPLYSAIDYDVKLTAETGILTINLEMVEEVVDLGKRRVKADPRKLYEIYVLKFDGNSLTGYCTSYYEGRPGGISNKSVTFTRINSPPLSKRK